MILQRQSSNNTDRFLKTFLGVSILLASFLLTSCSEINTNSPNDTYRYWAETNPPADMELMEGQYWQSAHWTREYIVYLKLKPTDQWWNEFITENRLAVDKGDWEKPTDAPTWFNPSENSVQFVGSEDLEQGSRYFRDPLTGVCYIYEIQL